MKVIKFVPAFSRLSQTFIYGLAVGLAEQLSGLRVLTLERENEDLRPFSPVDILHDVTDDPEDLRIGLIQKIFGDPEQQITTYRLGQYFQTQRPDLVHAHFGPGAAVVSDACHEAGIPLVVSLRGYDASRLVNERKWRRIYPDLFAKCRAIVLICDDMLQRIEPFAGQTPMVTIHAGKIIDEYSFSPPTDRVCRLLTVGRLVEKKGHDDAIRAVAKARDRDIQISLRIVGDGEMRSRLKGQIERHDLSDHVQLVGRLSHDEVKEEFRRAQGFLLACKTGHDGDKEGIPNVLKEAQLMGLPVIATRHAGIPDAIPKSNHPWLAEEGDWQKLSDLIEKLHHCDVDSLCAIAARGRNHVETHFSRQMEVERHLDLYSRIVSDLPGEAS